MVVGARGRGGRIGRRDTQENHRVSGKEWENLESVKKK